MSNKIKPWQKRKPRHPDNRKKVIPLRAGGDERLVPLRAGDNRVIPLRAGDSVEDDWWDDEEQGSFRP